MAPPYDSGDAFDIGELPDDRMQELQAQFSKFDADGCAMDP